MLVDVLDLEFEIKKRLKAVGVGSTFPKIAEHTVAPGSKAVPDIFFHQDELNCEDCLLSCH